MDAIAQLLSAKGVVLPQEVQDEQGNTPTNNNQDSSPFGQRALATESVLRKKGLVTDLEIELAMNRIETLWGSDA